MEDPSSRLVYVRVKPSGEVDTNYVALDPDGSSVTFKSLKPQKHTFLKHQISSYSFHFASILQKSDQNQMFNLIGRPALDSALSGTPSCIISVGGHGSGKTYTLVGPDNDYSNRGLIPRAISHLFQKIAGQPDAPIAVRCSYMEFINNQLYDVLNAFDGQPSSDLKIVESKSGRISVKDLLCPVVADEQSALERLFSGNAQRSLHPDHLRVTSVFSLWFDSDLPQPDTEKPLHSKIHFVDMATPEKLDISDFGSEEFHHQSNINRTMTVLERVLIAEDHIPYRSTPFTHLLKDSLPNRWIVAHADFSHNYLAPTLSTLKFAARVQGQTSDDILNLKEHKSSQINRLQKEIDELRSQLRVKNPSLTFSEPDREEKNAISEMVTSYITDAVPQFNIRSLYEVRAALSLMKDQFRSQKVSVEEQLREKYVFTVKPPENPVVEKTVIVESTSPTEGGIAFFPLQPTEKEFWEIYKATDGVQIDSEISERKIKIEDRKAQRRNVGIRVNELKAAIDKIKGQLEDGEKTRLPPIEGIDVITEDEIELRQSLRKAKSEYKDNYSKFCDIKSEEEKLQKEVEEREAQMRKGFKDWLAEKQKVEVEKHEEEEESEELLDKEERREYAKLMEQDPKARPFFIAEKRVKKILEMEFRANGTRRQAVKE